MEMASFILILAGVIIVGAVFVLRLRRPSVPREAFNDSQRRDPLGLDETWTATPEHKDDAWTRRAQQRSLDEADLEAELRDIEQERNVQSGHEVDREPASRLSHRDRDVIQTAPEPAPARPRAEVPVVLHVIASNDELFSGLAIVDAMRTVGMGHGDMNIFHYYPPGRPNASAMFSAANMLKPGDFDLEAMPGFTTKGIVLFMLPGGSSDDVSAFDTMLETAGRLAELLKGEVRDERRNALTRQGVQHTRERLATAGLKARASQP